MFRIAVDPSQQTLCTVENLIFGSKGEFRSELSPKGVARWVFLLLEIDHFHDPENMPTKWGVGQYCDLGPGAAAVTMGRTWIHIRYHAAGPDEAKAREWFLKNDHVRENGELGPHVPSGRAVR